MTFKKHNPGCPCACGGEEPPLDCTDRCWWKCIGNAADLPLQACAIGCVLRVEIPTPDTIDFLDGPGCPPVGIGCESHPCNACYTIWDRLFYFFFWNANTANYLGNGWSLNEEETDNEDCNNGLQVFDGPTIKCWTRLSAECPDVPASESWPIQCEAEIELSAKLEQRLVWDGECGYLNIKLIMTVTQLECTPIIGTPFPATTYTYEFQRDWCNCEDLLGALTYVGVTSVNNERGITVADPCNLDAATLTLLGNYDAACGAACACYQCDDGLDGEFTINVSGSNFNGSIVLTKGDSLFECQYDSDIFLLCDDDELAFSSPVLTIECLPCNKYVMRLRSVGSDSQVTAISDPFECGDVITLNIAAGYTGCLSGHTITVS